MPKTKSTTAGSPGVGLADAMYAAAGESLARLKQNIIDAELGVEVDPQDVVDDAKASNIPLHRVASAAERVHSRRMRAEAYEAADWPKKRADALQASRDAQAAVAPAEAEFEAAQAKLRAVSHQAQAAVGHSSNVQRQAEEARRTFEREMREDSGAGADVFDWQNFTL